MFALSPRQTALHVGWAIRSRGVPWSASPARWHGGSQREGKEGKEPLAKSIGSCFTAHRTQTSAVAIMPGIGKGGSTPVPSLCNTDNRFHAGKEGAPTTSRHTCWLILPVRGPQTVTKSAVRLKRGLYDSDYEAMSPTRVAVPLAMFAGKVAMVVNVASC